MAVTQITSDLAGIHGNISDVSVTMAVPSLNPTELGGGTGSIRFGLAPMARPQTLRNQPVVLSEKGAWSVAGRISNVEWGGLGGVTLDAETSMQRLNVTVALAPSYTLSEAAAMDLALAKAGFTSSGLATTGVSVFPGWSGTLLDYVKHFCNAYNVEYYITGSNPDTLFFRPLRSNTLSASRNLVDPRFGVADQDLAQNIEVVRYTYVYPPDGASFIEFTPAAEDGDEPQIITVDAGATVVTDIKLDAWVLDVNQPVAADNVGPEARTDAGAYQVLGSDGLPVTAATWVDQGGVVSVATTDDPTVIRVSVTAPAKDALTGSDGDTRPSPYSLSVATDETSYSSLHITGRGVRFTTETLVVATGVAAGLSYEEVGATIENPFVASNAVAWDVGARGAQYFAGANLSVTLSVTADEPFEDILGAGYAGDVNNFRVDGVTYGDGLFTVTGSGLTTIDDFDSIWLGATFADFDAYWAAHSTLDFDTFPLLRG